MITIRPGPNMDANPAGLVLRVFLLSYSPVICVLGEEIYCVPIS
jgi:hypothetical protein